MSVTMGYLPEDARLEMYHDDPEHGTGVVCVDFGPVLHLGGSLLAHLTHTDETADVLKEHVKFDPPMRHMYPRRIVYDADGKYWVEGDAIGGFAGCGGCGGQAEPLTVQGVPVTIRAEAFIGGVIHFYAQNGNMVYRVTRFDHEKRCYIGEWA